MLFFAFHKCGYVNLCCQLCGGKTRCSVAVGRTGWLSGFSPDAKFGAPVFIFWIIEPLLFGFMCLSASHNQIHLFMNATKSKLLNYIGPTV